MALFGDVETMAFLAAQGPPIEVQGSFVATALTGRAHQPRQGQGQGRRHLVVVLVSVVPDSWGAAMVPSSSMVAVCAEIRLALARRF